MEYRDAFRAQLYLSEILALKTRLENKIKTQRIEIDLSSILTEVANEIDSMILPCFVTALSLARERDELDGNTPEERYISFFIKNNKWTSNATDFKKNNKHIFRQVRNVIDYQYINFCRVVDSFIKDYSSLSNIFGVTGTIRSITFDIDEIDIMAKV